MNIEKLPFKAKGSYISISKDAMSKGNGIWIRSLIRPEWGTGRAKVSDHMFRITPIDCENHFSSYKTNCEPWLLQFENEKGNVDILFSSPTKIIFSIKNAGIVLEHDHDDNKALNVKFDGSKFKCYFPITRFSVELSFKEANVKYDENTRRIWISPKDKDCFVEFSADIKGITDDILENAFANQEDVEKSFMSFASNYSLKTEREREAIYCLWASEYSKAGLIPYRVSAISINNMNLVWSWDNCFIALALLKSDKELAYNNFKIFLDNLKEDGQKIDAINPAFKIDWFTKPPVEGVFMPKILAQIDLQKDELEDLYVKLKKATMWWAKNKNEVGLYYYSHPFDSGWDNATCFDHGNNLVTPDLNAFLAAQMFCLSNLAKKLGKLVDAEDWKSSANNLVSLMQEKLFVKGEFCVMTKNGDILPTTSLIKFIPLILGERLNPIVRNKLISDLKKDGEYLAPFSFATESLHSPQYDTRKGDSLKPNPYWRGPVWAPSTFLLWDALVNIGEKALAHDVAKRYIKCIEQDEGGFYENYDAITGCGFDDTGYGWTVAVYVLMKNL